MYFVNIENLSYKIESKNSVPLLRCKLITPHIDRIIYAVRVRLDAYRTCTQK